MWEVRFFFGIDDGGFQFLKDLKDDIFLHETRDLENTTFVEYFIRISGHNSDDATRILEIAEKELKVYASVLMLNGYDGNLKVDHPRKINEDGTKTIYAFFKDEINITDSNDVSVNGEVVYSSYQGKISNNKMLLENALASNVKKELLILLGCEQNWINAYKIYEILRKHFKSEKELKNHKELKDFAHTANSPEAIGIDNARHAVQYSQNPKKIANIETSFNKLIELSLEFITQDV